MREDLAGRPFVRIGAGPDPAHGSGRDRARERLRGLAQLERSFRRRRTRCGRCIARRFRPRRARRWIQTRMGARVPGPRPRLRASVRRDGVVRLLRLRHCACVAGTLLLFPGGPLDAAWRINPAGSRRVSADGRMVPLLLLAVVGAACAAAAIGLWRNARWGHRLAIGILGVNCVGDVVNAWRLTIRARGSGFPSRWLIAYLIGRGSPADPDPRRHGFAAAEPAASPRVRGGGGSRGRRARRSGSTLLEAADPPVPGPAALLGRREPVLVQQGADEARGPSGKGFSAIRDSVFSSFWRSFAMKLANHGSRYHGVNPQNHISQSSRR